MRRSTSVILVVAVVGVVACADSGSTATSSTVATTGSTVLTTPTASTTTERTTTTVATTVATSTTAAGIFRIKVEDGVKTEGIDTLSVRVGEVVRFEVEADVADEIHVHGFDLRFATVPDEGVLVEFGAEAAGIFEVELEGAGLHLLDVEVTP